MFGLGGIFFRIVFMIVMVLLCYLDLFMDIGFFGIKFGSLFVKNCILYINVLWLLFVLVCLWIEVFLFFVFNFRWNVFWFWLDIYKINLKKIFYDKKFIVLNIFKINKGVYILVSLLLNIVKILKKL